jgi:hypothetical protein
MVMTNKVYKQAAFIVIPLAIASAFIEPVKLPLGILTGALLAIVNFRGMIKNLEGLIGADRPTVKLVFMSIVRLVVIFAIIIALAVAKAVNLLGLMVGFTVIVVLVVKEGYIESQEEPPEEPSEEQK